MRRRSWSPGFAAPLVAALVLIAAVSLAPAEQSQGGGQTTPPGGGGGTTPPGGGATNPGSGTANPTRPTNPTQPGQSTTSTTTGTSTNTSPTSGMDFRRPMYLTGRVMMDDGTAPPSSVVMMLVCNGQPRPQGYTDPKGRFSITLGQNQAMMADASISELRDSFGRTGANNPGSWGGYSERDIMGCDFRADLPGYRSDVINLSGRRVMDNPEIGTIVLHRLANVQGFTYSMTTANAPKEAKKLFDRGHDQLKKKKYADAEASLRKAVELYPKYALAWNDLGLALTEQKKKDEARAAFEQSVNADAKFLNPHIELLQFALSGKDWNEIAARSEAVLKLNPFNYPNVWFVNGAARYNLKDLSGAEKSAREAVKLDSNHRLPRASQLLGVILAEKGDYPGALEQMRGYLSFAPNAPDIESVRKQVSELERLTGVKATAQTPNQN